MNLKAFGSAATLSFTVALGSVMFAQAGQPTTPGQQRQGIQGMDGQTVTVTGCLVRASDLRGGAAGTTAGTPGTGTTPGTAGASSSDYVLANVQMRSTSPGGTTAGTPTGGADATAPSARGTNLRLTGSEDSKLTEHVNHQVEITGTLSMRDAKGAAAGTTGTTGAPGTTGTPGTPGATAKPGMSDQNTAGQLQVQTIRATGQTCKAGA